MAEIFPTSGYRQQVNKVLSENSKALEESKSQERFRKNQEEILAVRKRIKQLKEDDSLFREGFKLQPYAEAITQKSTAASANQQNGFFASFNNLATEYIKQNSGNKEALDKFKGMNALEQRKFLKDNLNDVVNKAGAEFVPAFKTASGEEGATKADFMDRTEKSLTSEIKYLTDNATKADLEFQRYKDIYNVPYWTNRDMNNFLQSDGKVYPSGSASIQQKTFDENTGEGQKAYKMYKGGSAYGSFMLDYKRDRNSADPEMDFLKKVKETYNSKPVVDRFGSTTLADRFKNKLAYADSRNSVGGFIDFGSRLTGAPYFNTMAQARESGAIAPNEWFNPIQGVEGTAKNFGEMAFDTGTLVSPWGKFKPIAKITDKANAMTKAAIMGGIVGAKGAFEGEEKADPSVTIPEALLGVGLGGAGGLGVAYGFSRRFPKVSAGSGLDKSLKEAQAAYKADVLGIKQNAKNSLEDIANQIDAENKAIRSLEKQQVKQESLKEKYIDEINQSQEQNRGLKLRKDIFSSENLNGLKAYARNLKEPTDPVSAKNSDVIDWMQNKQKTHLVENPEFVENIEAAPYEVAGFDYESPLQNMRRPSAPNTQSPSYQFFEATGYNPSLAGVPAGEGENVGNMVERAGEYITRKPEYENALNAINPDISGDKEFGFGARIFNEMKMYEDEPIAKFVIDKKSFADKSSHDAALQGAFGEWIKRNYPNGVDDYDNAQRIFFEKLNIANSDYWGKRGTGVIPEKYNTGRIQDSDYYKQVKETISNSDVLDGKQKQALLNQLKTAEEKGKTEEEISGIISDVLQNANGTPATEGNVAANVRKAVTPNLITNSSFERVKAIREMHKARSSLAQNAQNLRNEMQSTEKAIREKEANVSTLKNDADLVRERTAENLAERKSLFDEKSAKIKQIKQGFAPIPVYGLNTISKSIGNSISNNPISANSEDTEYLPITSESNFFSGFGSNLPHFGYYWNSPLMRMRQSGSFNISKTGAKK